MSQPSVNVSDLFNNARAEGNLSAASHKALMIPDVSAKINLAMGIPAIDFKGGSEVFLITMLVDDSYSIARAGNEQVIRDGVNMVRNALMDSKAKKSILMCVRYINGTVVVPYTPIDDVPQLDSSNYVANGGTPLYDMSVVSLGDIVAKSQEFSDRGVPVRSATLIVTDGHDEGSVRFRAPEDVRSIMNDVLADESHIVAAMGIQDDLSTDFRDVFTRMGVRDNWILTTSSSPSEMRQKFGTFSQTAVRASQGAAGFSQVAGGFSK